MNSLKQVVRSMLVLAWLAVVSTGASQNSVEPNTNVVVKGKVDKVGYDKYRNVTICLDTIHSNNNFWIYIAKHNIDKFKNLDSIFGAEVETRGCVAKSMDGCFIVAKRTNQLHVLGKPSSAERLETVAEEVELRVAAISAAIKMDVNYSHSTYFINCYPCIDEVNDEIVRKLSRYPVASYREPDFGHYEEGYRDKATGKYGSYISVAVESRTADETKVLVEIRQGMLAAIGQIVTLKKTDGVWQFASLDVIYIS